MKLIDEKGRVFGWINLIDLMVIIFAISVLPAFWYGYEIQQKKEIAFKELREKELRANELRANELRENELREMPLRKKIDTFLKEYPRHKNWFK